MLDHGKLDKQLAEEERKNSLSSRRAAEESLLSKRKIERLALQVESKQDIVMSNRAAVD